MPPPPQQSPQGGIVNLRVLLISHTCQSATEGQPKAEELSRLPGIDLRVVVPDRWRHYGKWRSPDLPECGYGLLPSRVALPWVGPAQFYLHWYPQLAGIIREFQPHVIDLWEEPWGLVSAHTCRLRARYAPQAKIVTETEQNLDKRLPPPFEQFRAYTLRHADYAVGRSSEALEILRRKGYRKGGEVVPNAVDTQLFRPLDRSACKQRLGHHGFLAGFVGRLVEEKGVFDLLRAVGLTHDTTLVMAGSGPAQPELERLAAEMGVSQRIRFLGPRPLTALPELMNALDVLVLPSRTTPRWKEQFGRVIIEAHACGTPVIGTDSGAIPGVVGDGGLVVPEANPGALARALDELQANPESAARFGASGLRQVQERYTWGQVAQRMASIYHCITGGRS